MLWSELHRLWREAASGGSRTVFTMRETNAPNLIPALPRRPHTACIPLHSRGRRTREASHGEGGLQAARGGNAPHGNGAPRSIRWCKSRRPVSLSGTPKPKTLRGAVRSRSITMSDADLHRPAALGTTQAHERRRCVVKARAFASTMAVCAPSPRRVEDALPARWEKVRGPSSQREKSPLTSSAE